MAFGAFNQDKFNSSLKPSVKVKSNKDLIIKRNTSYQMPFDATNLPVPSGSSDVFTLFVEFLNLCNSD